MTLEHKRLIRSYGRIRGRKLSCAKQSLYDNLLPQFCIDNIILKAVKDSQIISPFKTFSDIEKYKSLQVEVGYGFGEHLAYQAISNPNAAFIGCETHINGIISLLEKIKKHNIKNIFLFTQDARILFTALSDNSIDKLFILFPDPWPKKKHNKRRLISKKFLDIVYGKLMKYDRYTTPCNNHVTPSDDGVSSRKTQHYPHETPQQVRGDREVVRSDREVVRRGDSKGMQGENVGLCGESVGLRGDSRAQLRIASDHQDYISHIIQHTINHQGFRWIARSKSDWQNEPEDWTQTKYQRKAAKEGRKSVFLNFACV